MTTKIEPIYKTLYSSESAGSLGSFGLKILVSGDPLPDLESGPIRSAAYKAADLLMSEIRAAALANNPASLEGARAQRAGLLALLEQPIYVEEIPNGYCSQWCCRHLPWFVVTTRIGRITIGWRKMVISIDWTGTLATKSAEELFPEEKVTKDGRSIHAWSYEDARRYVTAVIASVE